MANPHPRKDWVAIQAYYDEGHTWREISAKFGVTQAALAKAAKRGDFVSRDNSTANKLSEKRKDFKHSDETKAKLSAIAIAGGYGGKNRRKIFEYNGITLESSYELIVAQELDAANVKWTRPGRFPWIDSVGKPHHYTPDFYLPQYDIYLDPKNDQLIKVDSEKIHFVQEQNCIKVFVLDKQNLTWDAIKRILQENGVIGGLE